MGLLRVAGERSNTLRGARSNVMQTLRLRADEPIIAQPLSIRGGQDPRSRDVVEDERHGCVMGKRGLAEKGIASTRARCRCRGDSKYAAPKNSPRSRRHNHCRVRMK